MKRSCRARRLFLSITFKKWVSTLPTKILSQNYFEKRRALQSRKTHSLCVLFKVIGLGKLSLR